MQRKLKIEFKKSSVHLTLLKIPPEILKEQWNQFCHVSPSCPNSAAAQLGVRQHWGVTRRGDTWDICDGYPVCRLSSPPRISWVRSWKSSGASACWGYSTWVLKWRTNWKPALAVTLIPFQLWKCIRVIHAVLHLASVKWKSDQAIASLTSQFPQGSLEIISTG